MKRTSSRVQRNYTNSLIKPQSRITLTETISWRSAIRMVLISRRAYSFIIKNHYVALFFTIQWYREEMSISQTQQIKTYLSQLEQMIQFARPKNQKSCTL